MKWFAKERSGAPVHPEAVVAAASELGEAFPSDARAHLADAIAGESTKAARAAVSAARTMALSGTPLLLPIIDRAARAGAAKADAQDGYATRELYFAALELMDALQRHARAAGAHAGAAETLRAHAAACVRACALQTLESGADLALRGALRALERAEPDRELSEHLDAFLHRSASADPNSELAIARGAGLRLLARVETARSAQAVADTEPSEPADTSEASSNMSLLARLERELRSGSRATQRAAIDVLHQRMDLAAALPEALAAIVDQPRDPSDAAELLRGRALSLLAKVDPDARETAGPWYARELNARFLDLAQRDEHPQVRATALKALSNKTADPEALREACVAALEDEHPLVRATAAELLSVLLQRNA